MACEENRLFRKTEVGVVRTLRSGVDSDLLFGGGEGREYCLWREDEGAGFSIL